MSWTDVSRDWLARAIYEHPDMDKKTLRRWCRKNYPFAQRRGWAYKAWLKVLRAHFDPQSVRPARCSRLSTAELERLGQQRLAL